jgi:hypothetical protein
MIRLFLLLLLALPLAACGVDGAPTPPGAAAALPAGVGPDFGR